MFNGITIFEQGMVTEWQLYPIILIVGFLITLGVMLYLDWEYPDNKFDTGFAGCCCILLTGLALVTAGVLFPKPTGEYTYTNITNTVEIADLQNEYDIISQNLITFVVKEKE